MPELLLIPIEASSTVVFPGATSTVEYEEHFDEATVLNGEMQATQCRTYLGAERVGMRNVIRSIPSVSCFL